jgi:hypothetical protein
MQPLTTNVWVYGIINPVTGMPLYWASLLDASGSIVHTAGPSNSDELAEDSARLWAGLRDVIVTASVAHLQAVEVKFESLNSSHAS